MIDVVAEFLVYVKNTESYDSIGELYNCLYNDINKKIQAEQFWGIFEGVLDASFNNASFSGNMELHSFSNDQTYLALKGIFSDSFLSAYFPAVNLGSLGCET